MGGTLEGIQKRQPHILSYAETPGEGIILVEQYWKYKKDLTGSLLGVKHGYLVTTTQNGQRSKWDIIWHPSKGNLIRKMKYSPSQDDGFYAWQRIKVEPNLTETDLQQKIDQSNLAYDVMTYNCWHHSNSLYTFITGNVTHDYPGRGVLESWKSILTTFMTHEDAIAMNKKISDSILRTLFGHSN